MISELNFDYQEIASKFGSGAKVDIDGISYFAYSYEEKGLEYIDAYLFKNNKFIDIEEYIKSTIEGIIINSFNEWIENDK